MTYNEEEKHKFVQVGQNLDDKNQFEFSKQYIPNAKSPTDVYRFAMNFLAKSLERMEEAKNNPDMLMEDRVFNLERMLSSDRCACSVSDYRVWYLAQAIKMQAISKNIDLGGNRPQYFNGTEIEHESYEQETKSLIEQHCNDKIETMMKQMVDNESKLQSRIETLEAKFASQDVIPNLLEISSINEEIIS
jgi:hypothetical protein